jgi:simple sugar transport system ATP-binding protein
MLELEGVSKSYGSLKALDRVSASFVPGEIHAVLGENGAGKSTLMGVLSGFVLPDSGTARLDRKPLPLGKPFAVKSLGIEMVHQHFMLVPAFTVAENFALYRLEGLYKPASVHRQAERALSMARKLGLEIDPNARTGALPVDMRQMIEIVKALSGDARTIILDEPTAVLTPDGVEKLFGILRQLKAEGKTVILIAHKLAEVMRVADRVTVLRKGRVVASSSIADVDEERLAEWMVGGLPPLLTRPGGHQEPGMEVRLESVRGDEGNVAVADVSFEVRRGEILGIGGVEGNGQTELAEAVARVRPFQGSIDWRGQGPMRIGYIPQDRQTEGLALRMSVQDNLLVVGHKHPELSIGPFLRISRIRRWTTALVDRFNIATAGIDAAAGSLSGGNQQKVVVARALDGAPSLLVAVNPTRGLDIQATAYVHAQLLEARAAGAAILLVSSDLDELSQLSDRRKFMLGARFAPEASALKFLGASA